MCVSVYLCVTKNVCSVRCGVSHAEMLVIVKKIFLKSNNNGVRGDYQMCLKVAEKDGNRLCNVGPTL